MTVLIIDKLLYLYLKKVNQFLLRFVQSTIFFISLHSFISVINWIKMNNLVIYNEWKSSKCHMNKHFSISIDAKWHWHFLTNLHNKIPYVSVKCYSRASIYGTNSIWGTVLGRITCQESIYGPLISICALNSRSSI